MPNIGIVAAGGLLGAAAESTIPIVGPTLIDFDFINEIYEVNETPTTVAAIITTPGAVGASGLNIPLSGTPNTILGDAATILLTADWTVAIEFESTSTSGTLDLFSLAETPIVGFRDLFRCGYPSSPNQWWAQDDDQAFTPRTCVVGTKATGIHQIAITRTDTKLRVAVDGDLSLEAASSKTLDEIDTATFGGPAEDTNGREANILTFRVYNEQTDAVLVALSGGVYVPPTGISSSVGLAAGSGAASATSETGTRVATAAGIGTALAVGTTAGVTAAVGSAAGIGTALGAPPWSPASITGLAIWLKGDDLVGSDGSDITTWEDASGNNRDGTDVAAAKPKLDVAEQNGLNVVRFSDDGGVFALPDLSGFGTTSGSLFFVIKNVNNGGSSGPQFLGTAGNANHYLNGTTIYNGDMSTARKTVGDPGSLVNSWHIGAIRSAANDFKVYLNGTQFFTTATNTVAWSATPVVGAGNSFWWQGLMAEWILVSPALTAGGSDWLKVEGYLAHKWGVTSVLDAGHPYKTTPP